MAQKFGVEQNEIAAQDTIKANHVTTLYDVLTGSVTPTTNEFSIDSNIIVSNGISVTTGDVSLTSGNLNVSGSIKGNSYESNSTDPNTVFGTNFSSALATYISSNAPSTTNNYVTDASFNSTTETLTLTRSGLSDLTTTISVPSSVTVSASGSTGNINVTTGPNYGISLSTSLSGIQSISNNNTAQIDIDVQNASPGYVLRLKKNTSKLSSNLEVNGNVIASGGFLELPFGLDLEPFE